MFFLARRAVDYNDTIWLWLPALFHWAKQNEWTNHEFDGTKTVWFNVEEVVVSTAQKLINLHTRRGFDGACALAPWHRSVWAAMYTGNARVYLQQRIQCMQQTLQPGNLVITAALATTLTPTLGSQEWCAQIYRYEWLHTGVPSVTKRTFCCQRLSFKSMN